MENKYDVIVLAGGKGTRLRSVITDVPKPMAPIGDKPFLAWLLESLDRKLVNQVILSVGYKAEVIRSYFGNEYVGIPITYTVENIPMGTGGGIRFALESAVTRDIMVINGDTFFALNHYQVWQDYQSMSPDVFLCLKEIQHSDRYGTVQVGADSRIYSFREKDYIVRGFINGGVYLFPRERMYELLPKGRFSFENDFLGKRTDEFQMYGIPYPGYFIDIGIPEDYQRAIDYFTRQKGT